MDGLRRGASNGADRERLGRVFWRAVVAFGFALSPPISMHSAKMREVRVAHPLDDLDLAVEACGAALDQRDVGCEAHPVDMSARIQIVERVEDKAEALEPRDVELVILDVVVVCYDAHIGVELGGRLFGNLSGRQRMRTHVSRDAIVAIPAPWTS